MADSALLTRAAHCYLRAGWPHEAARCYRKAGEHRRAAEAWESVGALHQAAADYAAAGHAVRAAWLLVHHLGEVATARAVLAAEQPVVEETPARLVVADLLRRLVLARCDVADGSDRAQALATLQTVMHHLACTPTPWFGAELEPWAVEVAQAMTRPDLVPLIFAAAVRGGHHEAAQRWDEWSRRALGVPLQLPDPADDVGGPSTAPL